MSNNMTTSSRLYIVANTYLSGLQKGLQTAHAVGDLSVKYENNKIYKAWASQYKTIIILDGGNSAQIKKYYTDFFESLPHEFPRVIFHEDEDSLAGAATVSGVIIPDDVREYELSKIRNGSCQIEDINNWDPLRKTIFQLSNLRLS